MVFLRHIFAFDSNSPLLFTQFYFWAFFALVYAVFAMIMEVKPILKEKHPSLQGGAGGRPTSPKKRQQGNARVILYLFALVFTFCACILFNSHHGDIGAFCLLAAGICIYAIYKYLK